MINLNELSVDELHKLNRQVLDELQHRSNQRKYEFSAGMQVFVIHPKTGQRIEGTIVKMNRTRASVRSGLITYEVPFSLLNLLDKTAVSMV